MGYKRRNEWEEDTEVYSPSQVESILGYCGIRIENETNTHFMTYCPFHNNRDDPAFVVDKVKGLWTCFNPSCAVAGNIENLLYKVKGLNYFQARRVILERKSAVSQDVEQKISEILTEQPEFVQFPTEPVKRMTQDLWNYPHAIQYLEGRGFTHDTLKFFEVGYSAKKDMTIVPMHDPSGMLVGFVGRAIADKRFKNTDNLPKSKTMWNFHRAKRHGEKIIICESSFDAMRIHQAGYPNVVALLGGSLSKYHIEQLNKTASTIIIMSDFDKKIYRPNCRKCDYKMCKGHRPGRELGWSIAEKLPHKKILWAAYDGDCVYPHGAKDAGDMTDNEIRQCLSNAVTHFEYTMWEIDDKDLATAG